MINIYVKKNSAGEYDLKTEEVNLHRKKKTPSLYILSNIKNYMLVITKPFSISTFQLDLFSKC